MNLKDFELLADNDDHYEIKHPRGRAIKVSKRGLNEKSHKAIKALIPHYAQGAIVEPGDAGGELEEPSFQDKLNNFVNDINGAVNTAQPVDAVNSANQVANDAGAQALAEQRSREAPDSLWANADRVPSQAAIPEEQDLFDRNSGAIARNMPQVPGAAPQMGAPAMPAMTPNRAPAQSDWQRQLAANEADFQKIQADRKASDDMHEQELKNLPPEDRNRIFKNMSTGQKLQTGLALILGGIGSAYTGKNVALDMMNKAIDDDIAAQRSDRSNKMNLWKMHREALGDDLAANIATKNNILNRMKLQVDEAMGNAPGPMMQARAAAMKQQINMQMAQNNAALAAYSQASGPNVDPATLVRFRVPEPHQKAVFEEIQRAQDTRHMGGSILKAFDQAVKDNTVMKTGAGIFRTPGSVLALHQAMQPTFKDLEGTVRQAAMDNTFKNITPAPGDMESTIKEKRAALVDYLRSKASAPTAKGFGIDLDKFESTRAPQPKSQDPAIYVQWARANPNNPKAQLILQKYGTK